MIIRQAAERVVLVRPGPGLVSAAIVAGLDVWVVSDPRPHPPNARLPAELPPQRLLMVDFDDTAALRTLLTDTVRRHGIGQVLHLASDLEKGLDSGAAAATEEVLRELSTDCGKPARGLPDAVTIRRILNESRTSAVRAEEARSVTEACSLAEDFPLPVVIKSADRSGCWWTVAVHDRPALARWAEQAVIARHSAPYLVEELLTGDKFRVETLTVDGMHLVADIAPEGTAPPLHDAEQAGIRATVRALLDLAGYESGTTRTDVLVSARGSRIAAATEPDREQAGNRRSRSATTGGNERGTDR
ncbi:MULTISPECIES: ATP-grasp domain-containing protein [unclassified Streptomyces]|uniref:ATP-grasp domain-containing protein n=1 Tax=unclassified Streptomyces TaxID=2593676 RepID=UPI000690A9AE|nr:MULTISPECIES: ATP-grasp domain-containing protein [unclassified Streptomyces]